MPNAAPASTAWRTLSQVGRTPRTDANTNKSGTDNQNRYSTEITAGADISFEIGGPRPHTKMTKASADPD
jgi:hypothetical protein